MIIWIVIWIVFMLFWLLGGGYMNYEPGKPYLLGNTLLPWGCVLILGLIMFGAVGTQPIDATPRVVR